MNILSFFFWRYRSSYRSVVCDWPCLQSRCRNPHFGWIHKITIFFGLVRLKVKDHVKQYSCGNRKKKAPKCVGLIWVLSGVVARVSRLVRSLEWGTVVVLSDGFDGLMDFIKVEVRFVKVERSDLVDFGGAAVFWQCDCMDFFSISRPILLSFMWTWSIFSASHVEFCRPPKINHHISSFSFSVRTEKDFTFALLDDHGILACSTGIYTNNERVGGKETRENKRKAENNEGNWIYYKAYT